MDRGSEQGLRLRSIIVGLCAVALACWASCHSFFVTLSAQMAGDWFPVSACIVFAGVVFIIAPVSRLAGPRLALSRSDLLLIAVMTLVGASVSMFGFVVPFLSLATAPQYFSKSSNSWWEDLGQHMPHWLFPTDRDAIFWYWEGAPLGESIPWGAWVGPLAYWAVFFFALYLMSTAIVAIMRKQWVENERLIFPLMEVVQSMLDGGKGSSKSPSLFSNRLFWIAFAGVLLVYSTHILNGINSSFPSLGLFGKNVVVLRIQETWADLNINIYPVFIAVGFLIKRDVLASVCFFTLICYFTMNVLNQLGYSAGPVLRFEGLQNPAMAWLGFGALVVFVLAGLYIGRRHLKDVLRKALFNSPDVDDAREIMPYRQSTIFFAVGFVTLFVFMIKMGMSLWVAFLFICFWIVSFLGLTRFLIEGGIIYALPTVSTTAAMLGMFGSKALGLSSMAALTACGVFANALRSGFMPCFANTVKLGEDRSLKQSALWKSAMLAVMFGGAFSLIYSMHMCYENGASNAFDWFFTKAGGRFYQQMAESTQNALMPSGQRLLWAAIGMALMLGLTVARYSFPWWPLHPMGLPVGFSDSSVLLGSLFIAWMSKTLIIRIGGVPLYNKSKPIFLGLFFGHIAAVGLGFVVDVFHGAPGTAQFFYYR